jgi:cytochrome c-type biogenesis protein CcmH
MIRALVLLIGLLAGGPVLAVQPDEVMEDAALEARARDISAGLRCPVCRNESIDDSNAAISRELRLFVRELLAEGKSDREVVEAIVARYGEYVLLRPEAEGANLVLWLAAPGLLLVALGVGWATVRRRASATPAADLSAEERDRLAEILKS